MTVGEVVKLSAMALCVSGATLAASRHNHQAGARFSSGADAPRPILASSMGIPFSVGSDTLLRRLYEWGLSFGESRADVRAKLGAPTSIATSASASPYTPTTDTVTLMTYPDLQLLIVRAGTDGREFLSNLSVTGNRVSLPIHVRFGTTTQARVIHLFGRPKSQQVLADTLVIGFAVPDNETGEEIHFYFLTDKLRKIRWVFYLE